MSDARILDRGYRRYDGVRLGPPAAMRSVALATMARIMGWRRPFRTKIFPILATLLAFIPAVGFAAIAAIPGGRLLAGSLPSFAEYFDFTRTSILILLCFAAPEAMCGDRRTGMVTFYRASLLSDRTYLAAKVAAVFAVLSFVTIAPSLFLLVAKTLEGLGPAGPGDFVVVFIRIVLAGVAVAAAPAMLALAISMFTDRNGIASAASILGLLVSGIVAASLENGLSLSPNVAKIFDVLMLSQEAAFRIFGEASPNAEIAELPIATVVGGNLLWVVAGAAILLYRQGRVPS